MSVTRPVTVARMPEEVLPFPGKGFEFFDAELTN
jgi:hypothetical protein